jgi:hypothetical protein
MTAVSVGGIGCAFMNACSCSSTYGGMRTDTWRDAPAGDGGRPGPFFLLICITSLGFHLPISLMQTLTYFKCRRLFLRFLYFVVDVSYDNAIIPV